MISEILRIFPIVLSVMKLKKYWDSTLMMQSTNYNPSIPRLIRDSAIKGESALYTVCASTFGDRFDEALLGAAQAEMDYIAYVDETWEDIIPQDRQSTMDNITFLLFIVVSF